MRQLSRNEKYEKQIGIYKPCNNLLAHRFMTMLTEKLIPVFSKARVKVRNATLFEYANLCKVAAFKELKQRV